MKALYSFLAFFILLASCTPQTVTYHNDIVDICNDATDNFDKLLEKVFIAKNYTNIDEELQATIKSLEKKEKELSAMKPFKGDEQLEKAALNYIDVLNNTAKNEITEYIGIAKKAEKALSDEGASLLEDDLSSWQKTIERSKELAELVDRNLVQADNNLTAAYERFMSSHHLKAPKDEFSF